MNPENNFLRFVKDNPLEDLKKFSGKFLSIGLPALYPERLINYLKTYEESCFDVNNFEIIIAIPEGKSGEKLEKEINFFLESSKLNCKVVKHPYDYWTNMRSHNQIIFKHSDPTTYFYMNNSDRSRPSIKNWDLVIKQYISALPDDLFMLKSTSITKHMKPRSSLHAAFFFPEHWGVFTRKFLETTEGFIEEHTGHDGACEMIQYFIDKNNFDYLKRDIVIPDLMMNEKSCISGKEDSKYNFFKRYYIGNSYYHKYWFSKKGMETYKNKSIRIFLAHEIWKNNYSDFKIYEDKKYIYLENSQGKKIRKISYQLSLKEYLREKFISYTGNNHGFNFAHKFYYILRTHKGYKFFYYIIPKINNYVQLYEKQYKKNIFSSAFWITHISNMITNILLTERINNQVEGLILDDDFKNFICSDEIEKIRKEKKFSISLKKLASIQEMNSRD